MTSPSPDRVALRKMLRARRRAYVAGLALSVRGLCFHALPSPVLSHLSSGASIAFYAAMGDEAPTDALALQLAARGHGLALPVLEGEAPAMVFRAWSPGESLTEGPYGVRQPSPQAALIEPDVIFVPMLGFDAALNRIGQGGGHYDRALAARPAAIRIGLAWSVQQVDALPVAAWDMPMDIIVTEQQFMERSQSR